ncbi:WXG100 family type VII secretion target [Collinsella tanakaei]|uniref:WXG100 family type VII secretion target n=1 Tax=Collinsella tanakaei TaxID=626935 RepID=UPI0025A403FD|nr:WXG100 family type VII secretion target [Collinsella tanakaei]MDM8300091.1 WXG100 family type VII secretion target [Collinsella tanakaei]
MANIRIDPDTMDQRANQARTEASNIGQVINNMNNLLSTLQSEWEGEASKSYAERYESDFKPSMQKAQQLLEEIAKALNDTARNMREQDAQIASGWRA